MGCIIVFASPGSCSFSPSREPQALCSTKVSRTTPFPHSGTRLLGVTDGGAGPQRPVSLTRGCGPNQSPQKPGKLIGHFEKAFGPSQAQVNIIKKLWFSFSLSLSVSFSACGPQSHGIHACLLHSHAVLEATWPVVMHTPHAGSRRDTAQQWAAAGNMC